MDFIDKRIESEQWQEIKASDKYGKGAQLPVLIDSDSKEIKN